MNFHERVFKGFQRALNVGTQDQVERLLVFFLLLACKRLSTPARLTWKVVYFWPSSSPSREFSGLFLIFYTDEIAARFGNFRKSCDF